MKKWRDLKGTAAHTRQKQSGGLFLVPRAGGGDALGPAGNPATPTIKNGLSLVDSPFLILNEKVAGFEGYGRAHAAKTVRWTVFSPPGWRRGRPPPRRESRHSDQQNPPVMAGFCFDPFSRVLWF